MKWIYTKDPIEGFLNRKGLDTKEKRERFFKFTKNDLRSSYKDLDAVVDSIINAINSKKNITIYGDYDCDGVNATVVLLRALKRLGVKANYFINHRFKEGYGMNVKGMTHLLEMFPETNFIITCDNGIAAQEGIQFALDRGIEVVCTDHHRQNGDIIVPTVDEWRIDENPELREECCGAEIARRVMVAVNNKLGTGDDLDDLITFSGIATIADVVKFTPANHYIAKRGLELLNNPVFPVIKLITQMIKSIDVDEETVGFQIAPLYNAVSRVTGESSRMVDVLMKDDVDIYTYYDIDYLIKTNEIRKEMTKENVERAKNQMIANDECITVAGDYDLGIAGLVCSTINEDLNRPVICLNDMKDGTYKGSARSYRDFDLKAALDECKDLLLGYGGHAGAAGLTIKEENIKAFRIKMNELVHNSGVLDEEEEIIIDYETNVDNIYDSTVEKLMSFAPFGNGFEKPNIAYQGSIKKVVLLPKKEIEKKHVSFSLTGNNRQISALWFNSLNKWEDYIVENGSDDITILATPKLEIYNGNPSFKLLINEIKTL